MIPVDLAARLRLLADSMVQPLTPARAITPELPAFSAGQRFTAQIQAVLPDGSFKALVAGRSVTLSLPHSAKAGDSLELVVVQRSPTVVYARLAEAGGAGEPTLSRAAQLIGALLAGRGGETAQPAQLARGQPILQAPPQTGALLAPLLKKALSESGVFYEAHQARWLSGRLPLAALLQEPQARLSTSLHPGTTAAPAPAREAAAQAPPAPPVAEDEAAPARAPGPERAPAATAAVPKDIAPIVQQQLDALATHHLAWQGQAWPGQNIEWDIEEPLRDPQGGADPDHQIWNTTLRLTLPRLGEVAATLSLTSNSVALALRPDTPQAAEDLAAGGQQLAAALAAAGLSLAALKIDHGDPA